MDSVIKQKFLSFCALRESNSYVEGITLIVLQYSCHKEIMKVFYILACRDPEDGVVRPKHVGVDEEMYWCAFWL